MSRVVKSVTFCVCAQINVAVAGIFCVIFEKTPCSNSCVHSQPQAVYQRVRDCDV